MELTAAMIVGLAIGISAYRLGVWRAERSWSRRIVRRRIQAHH
jgi:hypothetical protein